MSTEQTDYNGATQVLFDKRMGLLRRREEAEPDSPARRALDRQLDEVTSQIIQLHFGLVRSYVSKFTSHTSADDSADFEAAGVVGLMKAITTYDPHLGTFAQWAFRPIKREVLRAVRDADHPNLNPADFEKRPEIIRKAAELTESLGRAASADEVSVALGYTVDQVNRVLNAPHLKSMQSSVGGDEDGTSVGEMIADDRPDQFDVVFGQMSIELLERWGLTALTPRELFVLVRRFGLDGEPPQRLSSIGRQLEVVREAARQVESKALAKLGHPVVLKRLVRQGRDTAGDEVLTLNDSYVPPAQRTAASLASTGSVSDCGLG